ncbi:PEGA domain-containing protein [Alteromonas hispanica]|uniref:PEGA domain-containing protein n=1 Tax=Alteromonas hispanica TaxID=315421 RepID=A0A6L9MSU1_9ALTE|nr:PEGA domain-containing protein [Alteromonas hispanica]NDW21186.1 PEGA domain-containing protein [Alteromonas hispanica]
MKVIGLKLSQLVLLAVFIGGCASTEPELPETVSLIDGVYTIPESGVFINGEGDTNLELKPGEYHFLVKKPWHRDKVHTVLVERGQKQLLKLSPGQGFAEGEITVSPSEAILEIADEKFSSKFTGELDSGPYKLVVSSHGFYPLETSIEITTGEAFNYHFDLKPIPTSGSFVIDSNPSGASVLVNDMEGITPFAIDQLPFGSYSVSAVKQINDETRVVGEASFEFVQDGSNEFTVNLLSSEQLFESKWYSAIVAAELQQQKAARLKAEEEQRYRNARVQSPISVSFEIEELTDKGKMSEQDFAKALFTLLRVGDRIEVDQGDYAYLIWKRSSKQGRVFNEQVKSLWTQSPNKHNFQDDEVSSIQLSQGTSLITTLAYHLYRSRNTNPILDLDSSMHSLKSIELPDHDSEMTIVTIGGADVRLGQNDISVTPLIGFHQVKASSGTKSISWSKSPLKVLVVSEAGDLSALTLNKSRLKINEKSLVKLIEDGEVESIQRFTQLPDETWKYEVIEKSGPLASSLDLNVNEIGPHDISGQYNRVWLIRYLDKQNNHQLRQLSVNYAVGEDVKEPESDTFFRRKEAI